MLFGRAHAGQRVANRKSLISYSKNRRVRSSATNSLKPSMSSVDSFATRSEENFPRSEQKAVLEHNG